MSDTAITIHDQQTTTTLLLQKVDTEIERAATALAAEKNYNRWVLSKGIAQGTAALCAFFGTLISLVDSVGEIAHTEYDNHLKQTLKNSKSCVKEDVNHLQNNSRAYYIFTKTFLLKSVLGSGIWKNKNNKIVNLLETIDNKIKHVGINFMVNCTENRYFHYIPHCLASSLFAVTTYFCAKLSIKNISTGLNYKTDLESQLEQLTAIKTLLIKHV